MKSAAVRLVLASSFAATVFSAALPQDAPGKFDFYVLSLAWSPSFCAASDRAPAAAQCGERPYAFIVHGLWPQYESGFPRSCQIPAPRLPRSIMVSMLDLMPAPRLIYHEWDEHGTCSGLSPAQYFDTIRQAREAIRIPAQYSDLKATLAVNPDDVKVEFIKANPGLTAESISIDCDKKRLREVRICLTKDLSFRACPDVTRRNCRRAAILMPPVRGAGTDLR
jgi:ribonuclease T2